MAVKIGRMDRRIQLQVKVETQDASGEPIESWNALDTVWAEAIPLRGTERFASQQTAAEADTRFKIRYRSDVTVENRIVFDGDNYDITAVMEIGRREALEILATRRAE